MIVDEDTEIKKGGEENQRRNVVKKVDFPEKHENALCSSFKSHSNESLEIENLLWKLLLNNLSSSLCASTEDFNITWTNFCDIDVHF